MACAADGAADHPGVPDPGGLLRDCLAGEFLTCRSTTRSSTVPPVLVLALGLTFVIAAGEIDLSFPSVIAFSGYVLAMLYKDHGMVWPAVMLAIAAGALVGYINGLIVAYVGVPSIIATLATQFFWGGITTVISGGLSYSLRDVDETSMWTVFVGEIGDFRCRRCGRSRSPPCSGSS